MKILFVNDYLEKIGGAEIYMYTLKHGLEKLGEHIQIFGTSLSREDYNEGSIKHEKFNLLNRIFNVHTYKNFSQESKDYKPHIVHIHGFSNELSPSFLYKIKDMPVIMTVHNSMLVNAVSILSERTGKECKTRICGGCVNCVGLKGAMYESIKRNIHKQLLKKISLYITPSKYMKELMEEAGFSPVRHIPNGFKLFDYSPITNFNNLLYVGRLSKEKGVEYLIRAIPTVLKSHPTAKLTIVGDGPEKENIVTLIEKLDIQKNVTIHTDVKHDGVEKFYKDSTIVIVPSIYHDNLPTVCIEAMSVGRPLIGTRMGGIPELIDDHATGLLIEANNSEILGNAINKLLSNRNQVKEMSKKSYDKSKDYDINNHLMNIENTYKSLIGEKE